MWMAATMMRHKPVLHRVVDNKGGKQDGFSRPSFSMTRSRVKSMGTSSFRVGALNDFRIGSIGVTSSVSYRNRIA